MPNLLRLASRKTETVYWSRSRHCCKCRVVNRLLLLFDWHPLVRFVAVGPPGAPIGWTWGVAVVVAVGASFDFVVVVYVYGGMRKPTAEASAVGWNSGHLL